MQITNDVHGYRPTGRYGERLRSIWKENAKMRFMLTYVNLPDKEVYPDKEFDFIISLIKFVTDTYPDATSYGITVLLS